MVENEYLVIHGEAQNNEEAIMLCGRALYEAGLVKETFAEKCVCREKLYPTGLPTEIPVAIPHCKDDGIKVNSVCFLKLKKPVIFYRMDDDMEKVETDMVFNLAIKNPEEHLQVLKNLMKFFSDKKTLEKCRNSSDEEIIRFFQNNIG